MSFQPVVQYNQIYLFMIGIVAFLTQLQVLHLLRYHKTIAILGATLAHALWDLVSFAVVMGVIFFGFTSAIYLMYHDMPSYSTMSTAMGSQVCMSACNNFKQLRCYKLSVDFTASMFLSRFVWFVCLNVKRIAQTDMNEC